MSILFDRAKSWLQYPLPHHFLSRFVHFITRLKAGLLSQIAIRLFVKIFKVKLEESERKHPTDYESFNDFFTRSLSPGARPVDASRGSVASPVDGTISQVGAIKDGQVFQAKGHTYSVSTLLGGEDELASTFHNGSFVTIYLAPHNYHRIHAPLDMQLRSMLYVPGRLFSVNSATVHTVPNLFARNERVAGFFSADAGNVAIVLVGALFVGSIETIWAGEITPPQRSCTRHVYYNEDASFLFAKGSELGRFNMGSTVILLFQEDRVTFMKSLRPETLVRLGKKIAKVNHIE
ncbi:MAG: archaetidylserine decarboxylase [Gammaproteobacteria bacterium]